MNLTTKLFFEGNLIIPNSQEESYIIDCIKNCNPKGEFAESIGKLKKADDKSIAKYLPKLLEENYGMLIGYSEEEIIGSLAFQRHLNRAGFNWKIFNYDILKEYRGKRHCHELTRKIIKHSQENKIHMLEIGKPGNTNENKFAKKIIEELERKQKSLKIYAGVNTHIIYNDIGLL